MYICQCNTHTSLQVEGEVKGEGGEGGVHHSLSYEEYSGGERGGPSGEYYYHGGAVEVPWVSVTRSKSLPADGL